MPSSSILAKNTKFFTNYFTKHVQKNTHQKHTTIIVLPLTQVFYSLNVKYWFYFYIIHFFLLKTLSVETYHKSFFHHFSNIWIKIFLRHFKIFKLHCIMQTAVMCNQTLPGLLCSTKNYKQTAKDCDINKYDHAISVKISNSVFNEKACKKDNVNST